jgi:hypothetical protein
MTGRAQRRWLVALTVTVALTVVAGCSNIANLHIPTPPPGSPDGVGATTTTAVSNFTTDSLPILPTRPPPTVPLTPGTASLTGLVIGPAGVVSGATILVERLVNDVVGSKTVAAAADGTWKLANIIGGLYRIRAWQAPDLDLVTPQLVLLPAGGTQSVDLTLMTYSGQSANAVVSPSPPIVGEVAIVAVQVLAETVGNDGVVRGSPLVGANVDVVAAGNVVLAGTNPGTTNSQGAMALDLGCSSVGPVGLSALVNGITSFPLVVADCSEGIPSVSTPTSAPTSSSVP